MTPEESAQRAMALSRPDLEGQGIKWEGSIVGAIEIVVREAILAERDRCAKIIRKFNSELDIGWSSQSQNDILDEAERRIRQGPEGK